METTAHSTANLPHGQRAAEWKRVIAETYFPLELTYRHAESFSGRLERRQMGDVSLSRLATRPLSYERHARHISHIEREEYLVTVPRRSPVAFRQLGRDLLCAPGALILERGDAPYRFSYACTNELHVLKVPKTALGERLRDPDRFCARLIDARSGLAGLFTSMMDQLQALGPTEARAAGVLGRQVVEVLALALDQQEGGAADLGASPVRAGHLRRAEEIIRRNLSNPDLSPDLVAASCGISKRYLHEIFSEAERTVSRFIREERLIAARDAIAASPALPLAEIAYRFGFSDQAQFSRLFRAQFETTPSDWRKAARLRHQGEIPFQTVEPSETVLI